MSYFKRLCLWYFVCFFQCFDTVGCMTGRAHCQ